MGGSAAESRPLPVPREHGRFALIWTTRWTILRRSNRLKIRQVMEIPIREAKARLADLVRRAEAGDDVVLTRHGQAVARIAAFKRRAATFEERKARLDRLGE